ncbi:MAG: hypothetical protein C0467_16150 [Planctomycetaceae bacterium]|nr:hypothetical protein [Planctomycetaceae bacterium]
MSGPWEQQSNDLVNQSRHPLGPGIDRTLTGYVGLIVAQACLPNNDVRDSFALAYTNAKF